MRSLRDTSLLAEHQLDAVECLVPLLDHYGGALLADEPGLGKSFVAAEVARREVRAGGEVEAIVPASLVDQWLETFRRFGVPARVLTHTALPTAKANDLRRRLLVVDEAHAFRNPNTQRYAALARRSVGARLLLVTATPICNGPGDLEALLRLIVCDDALAGHGVPSIDVAFASRDRASLAAIVSTLMIRRDRTVLPASLSFGDLDRHVIWTRPGNDAIDAKIDALQFPLTEGAPLVRDFLRRRLESSEAALLESLRRQHRFYERSLECVAAGRALPKREYRRAFAHEEDAAAFQTILFWELFVPESGTIEPAAIHDAMRAVDELRAAVESLPREKERMLVDACSSMPDPILIFTGWSATAEAIAQALSQKRATTRSIDAFRRGAADVLVSTDVGAEGLNLQRAGVVIHYDLPWNPMRIEQRNGRAHRIGQKRDLVRVIFFLPDRHRGRVLQTVAQKNRIRRRLLGEAPAIPAAFLSSIRPRVTANSAIVNFTAAARAAGWRVPATLDRRHRAGVEGLLAVLSSQPVDIEAIRRLETMLDLEPWTACHRRCRFAPL